jgi:predicted DNA-binding antitoxin AbrB/MazE fold protein
MVRHIDAIFTKGAFQPLEPLTLPEGTCVHLSVEEQTSAKRLPRTPKIYSPKLVHKEDVAKFVMKVREISDAGI